MTTALPLLSRPFAIAALGLAMTTSLPAAAMVADVSPTVYNVEIPAAELNSIRSLLPEQKVNTAFVQSDIDPNLRLLKDAEITVTFIDEGAGYRNSFGYFLFDENEKILSTETIFANASEVGGGGSLKPGDTVNLGTFAAGTNIGFWLKGDGFANPNGYTYYTLDQYNPDAMRHVAIIADKANQQLVLGVEDLYKLGDKDYNDIIFTFTASPFSAIDIAGMPTGAPEAGPVATAMICATLFGVTARRRRRQAGAGGRNDRGR